MKSSGKRSPSPSGENGTLAGNPSNQSFAFKDDTRQRQAIPDPRNSFKPEPLENRSRDNFPARQQGGNDNGFSSLYKAHEIAPYHRHGLNNPMDTVTLNDAIDRDNGKSSIWRPHTVDNDVASQQSSHSTVQRNQLQDVMKSRSANKALHPAENQDHGSKSFRAEEISNDESDRIFGYSTMPGGRRSSDPGTGDTRYPEGVSLHKPSPASLHQFGTNYSQIAEPFKRCQLGYRSATSSARDLLEVCENVEIERLCREVVSLTDWAFPSELQEIVGSYRQIASLLVLCDKRFELSPAENIWLSQKIKQHTLMSPFFSYVQLENATSDMAFRTSLDSSKQHGRHASRARQLYALHCKFQLFKLHTSQEWKEYIHHLDSKVRSRDGGYAHVPHIITKILPSLARIIQGLSSIGRFWTAKYPQYRGSNQNHNGVRSSLSSLKQLYGQTVPLLRDVETLHIRRAIQESMMRLPRQSPELQLPQAPVALKFSPSMKMQQYRSHAAEGIYARDEAVIITGSPAIVRGSAGNDAKQSWFMRPQGPKSPHDSIASADESTEEPTQLRYQIPEQDLRRAMHTSQTSGAAYWQYSLYQGPRGERVKVHYCRSKETTERISESFLKEKVIGFDIEWKPNARSTDGIKKNVSLIQIAAEERIALFHVGLYKGDTIEDTVAPSFKRLMEDPLITKVGVAIKADCTRLRKFMNIDSRGLMELSQLYKIVKFSSNNVKMINKRLVGLAKQVEEHLLLPLSKGAVRTSDWSEPLSYQQIQYAASDTYAGLQLYHTLEQKRQEIDPTPPCPAHTERDAPIRLADGRTVAQYLEDEGIALDPDSDPTEEPTEPDVEEMARDFIGMAGEKQNLGPVETSKTPAPPSAAVTSNPAVAAAETWVTTYRENSKQQQQTQLTTSTTSTSISTPTPMSYMRAYHLWHHQSKPVEEIASMLRSPPLQTTSVASYIFKAVRAEKLEIDPGRFKDVMAFMPERAGWKAH